MTVVQRWYTGEMDETAPRFTPRQVTALTGVSAGRLARWYVQGLIAPAYADASGWLGYRRLYSVRNVLALRILYVLRNTHHIPHKYLLDANAFLKDRYDSPWEELVFYTLGGRVYFEAPDSRAIEEAGKAGQIPLPVPLEAVIAPVRAKIVMFTTRQPAEYGQIERRRGVMGGDACVAGTRIPTSAIWGWHTAGYDAQRIREAYPTLTDEDVAAAIEYERSFREQAPARRKRLA